MILFSWKIPIHKITTRTHKNEWVKSFLRWSTSAVYTYQTRQEVLGDGIRRTIKIGLRTPVLQPQCREELPRFAKKTKKKYRKDSNSDERRVRVVRCKFDNWMESRFISRGVAAPRWYNLGNGLGERKERCRIAERGSDEGFKTKGKRNLRPNRAMRGCK